MITPDNQHHYNYDIFDVAYYDQKRFRGPKVGEPFPEFHLVELSEASLVMPVFRHMPLVLETVSITCPEYLANIAQMNQLAREFPLVEFATLYVREEHPGTKIPPHKSLAEKRACADKLLHEESEMRTVYLDDLQGSVHKALGGLPNMLYIVNAEGIVTFRSSRTIPNEVKLLLSGLMLDLHSGQTNKVSAFCADVESALRVYEKSGFWAALNYLRSIPKLSGVKRLAESVRDKSPNPAQKPGVSPLSVPS